jgi:hypothetical protein
MSQPAATETAGRGAGSRFAGRRGLVLLAVVLAAGLALRLWVLPSADRLDVEAPGIANIESVVAGKTASRPGAAGPAWVPQLLVVELADWLRQAGGFESLNVLTVKGRITRHGSNLARSLSVLYGLAGLALLYPVARRLHSPGVALLAVLILCFTPWHIQGSVTFAPEILVAALAMLVLWLALRVLDRPSPLGFALVGIALGTAAGVRPTGALVALPVLAALVVAGRREPRRLLLPLVLTLPVAVVVWWLLAPPLGPYFEALAMARSEEARRAATQMNSHFTVLVYGLLHPLRESVHGRLVGTLALLGAAGQAFRCLFLIDPGPDRTHRLMVLATAPVFILGIAWATPLYRAIGFVPLLAFSALYAAVMLATLWDGLVSLAPRLGAWRPAVVVAALLAVALVVPPGWRFVYSHAVQSTLGAALEWSRATLPGGAPRVLLVEEAALENSTETVMEVAGGLGLMVVPRLTAAGGERLALADGVVFPHRRLDGADADFYRELGQQPARRKKFAGNLIWQRSPDLVVVLHPPAGQAAKPAQLPVEVRERRRFATVPAAPPSFATLTLMLFLPPTSESALEPPRVRLGDLELSVAPAGRVDGGPFFVSERLPTAPDPRPLRIEPPPWMSARRGEITVTMVLWP